MQYPAGKLAFVSSFLLLALAGPSAVLAQSRPRHYTLILEDPPVAERFASTGRAPSLDARSYRQQIEARQQSLKDTLATRRIQITGSASALLNAIFVTAPKDRLDELKNLPGVKGVIAGRRYHLNLNRATTLIDAPAAWNALGGLQNTGTGIKIAMLDTGIDQTHPAFQDSSLHAPAGFPICKTAYPNGAEADIPNCAAFTNNKVIVARSYVPLDAAGSDPRNPAVDSTPDDYSPRDRSGHGTGTASAAAGVSNTGPTGLSFNGVAPKAFLGNYKIFGSPEVNDFAGDDAIIVALEDALHDGMDVASLSLGGPAFTGPLDTGAACGIPAGVPCDAVAVAVENAVKAGMVVVVAAGNDGDGASSYNAPTLNSIESPGDAPSAITVGSTTNSHFMVEGVEVPGSNVPSGLQQIQGALGDGPFPFGATAAPLVDVSQLGDNGLACSALPAGSLNGAFALIERGSCNFSDKVVNAQNAGATGVIFYMADASAISGPGGLGATNVPAIMISNSAGVALKSFIDANAGHTAVIDPTAFEQNKSAFNLLSFFSSLGPSTGDNAIKPDLVAVGGSEDFFTDIYLATQSYDPLGDLYSVTRYNAGSGTSFATPLVSGAAALVKERHPDFSPEQIKSALVNTASQDVTSDEQGDATGIQSLGAGKLDVGAAIQTALTASPAVISFGVPVSLPVTKQFQITNSGSSSVSVSLVITPAISAGGASVALDQQSLTLARGAAANVNLTLSGAMPSAGAYSGFVTIQGGASTLRVPYQFLVGSAAVANLIVLSSPSDTTVGQDAGPIAVKLVDSNGVPVSGATVTFTVTGDASLQDVQRVTDNYGIASAEAFLGSQPGNYDFSARFGRMSFAMAATALPQPVIAQNGVLDAAGLAIGKPVAPGSYVSIFGANLANSTASATADILPLAIDFATVSFDVPSAQLSLPGHLVYASANQVNVQVPWELEGQSSVQVKVTVGSGFGISFGKVVTVPLADYAPAFFEIGAGQVAALDAQSKVIGASNPARRGQTVQLFANGLGPVDNQPASGDPATSSSSTCKSQATVAIGTQQIAPAFCGLAPDFAGLYQINATVPSSLAPGTYPVTITIAGHTSKASNIAVQ
ncbi:MAG: S8 family serine peptidase [Acidobacteriia bacterium]|nr:S8 family serine peptidase [Terriglobia bacterium]